LSEFRLNPATKEWVIIAKERADRPDAYHRHETEGEVVPERDEACPFCVGNERMTPPEIYRDPPLPADGKGVHPWQVRIVPNKYPALTSTLDTNGRGRGVFFRGMPGAGMHDVVIETPFHNRFTPLLSATELRRVLEAYRWRYLKLREDPRIKLITIFKNHGRAAGTSLIHPHSQIIATPIVPFLLRSQLGVAIRHYDDWGRSVYTEMLEEELADGRRIVCESGHFLAFCPFASKSPFEVWVLPRRECPSFGAVTSEELDDLAEVMGRILGALWEALDGPAFNFVIRTAPISEDNEEYYIWHVEIIPRISTLAGFEFGSGVSINVSVPEENAASLRRTLEIRDARG
jgi:UDPglucose--hexose-1-phosphate uridylyltransferase